MGVSENSGTPKSSILIGFSIINHPFWGTPIFGNNHMLKDAVPSTHFWNLGFWKRIIGYCWCQETPALGMLQFQQEDFLSHRIHVRYIYLHFVDFDGNCRQIYHTWILWVLYHDPPNSCPTPPAYPLLFMFCPTRNLWIFFLKPWKPKHLFKAGPYQW